MTDIIGPFYIGDNPAIDLQITVTREGEDIQLDDYNSASVTVFDPNGASVDWDASITIDTVNDVVNVPFPAVSPFDTEGLYTLYVHLSNGSNTETADPVIIRIMSMTSTIGWATVSDVLAITGELVTAGQLMDGQETIMLFSGRTTATPTESIKPRDQQWLKKAVAQQTIWQKEQPGYKTRHWIKEIVQDGTDIIYVGSSEPANMAMMSLAPLAARALKNLSWLSGKAVRLRSPGLPLASGLTSDEYRRNDDHGGWQPL